MSTKIKVQKTKNYTVMSNYHLQDRRLSFKAKGLLSFMLSVSEDWEYSVKGLASMAKDGVDSVTATLKELEQSGYVSRKQIRSKGGKFKEVEYTIYERPVTADNDTDVPSGYENEEKSEKPKQAETSRISSTEPNRENPVSAKPEQREKKNSQKTKESLSKKPNRENPYSVNPCSETPLSEKPYTENPAQINKNKINTKANKIQSEININSALSSPSLGRDEGEEQRDYNHCVELLKRNLEYDVICNRCSSNRLELVDYMIDVMAQTMLKTGGTVRIGGQSMPSALVKKRFSDLDFDDVLYVADRFVNAKTEVKNIKNYLLTALFNAKGDNNFTAAEAYKNDFYMA